MTRDTIITSPGRTVCIRRIEDPRLDELCERTGCPPLTQLPDAHAVRRVELAQEDPAWRASSLNAGDWMREYLEHTGADELTLDVGATMATPVREEYATHGHCHCLDYVPAHD